MSILRTKSIAFRGNTKWLPCASDDMTHCNPIQDGLFCCCSRMGGVVGAGAFCLSLHKICHTSYNDETWHTFNLPNEDLKAIWITWHIPWVLLTSAVFHWKSKRFDTWRNTDIGWVLIHNLWLFQYSWVFNNCFIKHDYIVDDVSKYGFSRPS